MRLIGEALDLYDHLPDSYSMGRDGHQLAKLTAGAERAAHLVEARRQWEPFGLPRLMAALDALGEEANDTDS